MDRSTSALDVATRFPYIECGASRHGSVRTVKTFQPDMRTLWWKTRGRRSARRWLIVSAVVAAFPINTAAQRPPPPGPDTTVVADTLRAVPCRGQYIAAVELRRQPPLIDEWVPQWPRPFLNLVLQHRQTRPTAIRPFLLVAENQRCTDFAVSESERMLRAQRYLADARIRAYPLAGDTVTVVVETVDEIALVADASLRGTRPASLMLGDGNLQGQGVLVAGEWRDGRAYRDGFGLRVAHYHLAGRAVGRFDFRRGVFDERYEARLTDAYLTDAQRTAWHAGIGSRSDYIGYLRDDAPPLSLQVEREHIEGGAIGRIGPRERRLVGGAMIAYERVNVDERGVVLADTGIASDPDLVLPGRTEGWRTTRLGVVVGGRRLRWQPLVGLDTLAGTQDVAAGAQVVATVGKGVAGTRSDPFAALSAYTATASPTTHLALAVVAEGRRTAPGAWRDVVTSVRLGWYEKPSLRRARIVSLELDGTWRASLPVQLTLADAEDGARGYRGSRDNGARRVVLRAEEQRSIGGMGRAVGFGVAAFTDAAKLWAGDMPFGTTTGLRASVGGSLLVTVPRASQQAFRIDVALPVVRDRYTRAWTLRLATTVGVGAFRREADDIARMRAPRPAAALLDWP